MIRSDDHSFNDILFQLGQTKEGRNGGINDSIHSKNLFKRSFDIYRNMVDVILQQLWNIKHINPIIPFFCDNADIEGKKLMVEGIVDSFLNCFQTSFDIICMILRPIATEILSIYGEFQHLRVIFLDSVENISQFVMEFSH